MIGVDGWTGELAWMLTGASEGELRLPGSPPFVRFLALFAVRSWLLLAEIGVPAAVRAIRGG